MSTTGAERRRAAVARRAAFSVGRVAVLVVAVLVVAVLVGACGSSPRRVEPRRVDAGPTLHVGAEAWPTTVSARGDVRRICAQHPPACVLADPSRQGLSGVSGVVTPDRDGGRVLAYLPARYRAVSGLGSLAVVSIDDPHGSLVTGTTDGVRVCIEAFDTDQIEVVRIGLQPAGEAGTAHAACVGEEPGTRR